ncbi:MAG: homocysteine S-methyltransferase family protein [Thermoguttaceae bacterium]|nr:homocysteine S-methyltransferase family protein [Thermoguttaceae bacterium]
MHTTLEALLDDGHQPVVLDGAWGTQLQALGLEPGESPDLWNLNHPEKVKHVARSYVEAGSQIILTNTFGANRLMLEKHGLADRCEAINHAGVEISRCAVAGTAAKVFASVGPSGKLLLMKQTTPEELADVFGQQCAAIAAAGAEGIVLETFCDLQEILCAVTAAKQTGLPVVGSLVFDSGKKKDRTMMGNTPEQVAEALTAAGVDVIGSNCGQGIDGFAEIARRYRAACELPIWIKGNAGLPVMDGDSVTYPFGPQEFGDCVQAIIAAGANFVGGCCGTSPAHIAEVVRRLR